MSTPTIVLSDVFPPQHGGSGKWLWEIYARQPTESYVMAVGNSIGADPRDEAYAQKIERMNLAMPFRGVSQFSSLAHYARQIRMIRRLALRHRAKMIHAARPLSEGLVARGVKQMTGIPYLCYVHGEDVNIAMTSRELKTLTRSVLKHCSCIVANSNFTRNLLLNEWSIKPEKVVLMHPGVDTSYFVPALDVNGRPSKWIGKTVLLTVGRLQKRKGHDTVIRALPKLNGSMPNLHYAIVGDGEEGESLEQLANELGVRDQVEFIGEIDDAALLNYHQHCDVFVLANRTIGRDIEGFGIVLLEAQSCGKPVVAGASGGTVDTLLAGKSGFVVPCDSTDGLEHVLANELRNPIRRVEMGLVGRKHVVAHFDWSTLAKRAQSLFASLHV